MNNNSNHNINPYFLPVEPNPQQVRLIPTYIKNQFQCQLCAQDFNLNAHVPMVICTNQHTTCLKCVNQIVSKKKQCPFCRKQIKVSQMCRNRTLCRMLQQINKKNGNKQKIQRNPQNYIYDQQGMQRVLNQPIIVYQNRQLNNNQQLNYSNSNINQQLLRNYNINPQAGSNQYQRHQQQHQQAGNQSAQCKCCCFLLFIFIFVLFIFVIYNEQGK